jgi:hypothetical protein
VGAGLDVMIEHENIHTRDTKIGGRRKPCWKQFFIGSGFAVQLPDAF